MKKWFLWFFVFLFVWASFAYTPITDDISDLSNLKSQLDNLVVENNINLRDFYDQLKTLEMEYTEDDRLQYMLANLKDYMYAKLFTLKTAAKVSSKTEKQDFLENYNTWFSLDESGTLVNCTGWYNTLDDISFAYNIPTALTIATWYRESTCAYYLPSNGDGPFQIVDKDYGTGMITEPVFVQAVEDFMKFTLAKFDRYEWQLSWSLSYTWFDLTWISNFAALYNGWTRSGNVIIPNAPSYLYDWYWEDYSGATRYWILPQFIKALDWEIENKY